MSARQVFDLLYLAVAGVTLVILALQARRVGGWSWAFPAIFALPALQAAYRVLTSAHVTTQPSAGVGLQIPPLVDRSLTSLFFLLLAYAFLRPLLPRLRGPLLWLLANNLVVLAGLILVVTFDYGLHWTPGMRFSEHWGPLAFEAYQIPLLLIVSGALAYIWRGSKSRYAALGALAFGLWTLSHLVHTGSLLLGFDDPATTSPPQWAMEVGALMLLALSVVLPDARGASFAERYAADADLLARRLQLQVEELTAAKAALEERARLARELHDSIAQGLFSIKLNAGAAAAALGKDPERARERLGRLQEIANQTHADLRSLIEELRPPVLEDVGLLSALQAHAAALKAQWGMEVTVLANEEGRLPADEEAEVYRIAYEALTNAAKHGQANRAEVLLQVNPPFFHLIVRDDGTGFDTAAPRLPTALGLRGMRERAALLGAELRVSSRPNGGTTVEARRPGLPAVDKEP